MAVIHIPRRTYSQPQGRVEVDWNNPLSAGLYFAVVPGVALKDVVGNVSVQEYGAGTKVLSADRFGLSYENPDNLTTQGLFQIGDIDVATQTSIMGPVDQTVIYVGSTYRTPDSSFGDFLRLRYATGISYYAATARQSASALYRYGNSSGAYQTVGFPLEFVAFYTVGQNEYDIQKYRNGLVRESTRSATNVTAGFSGIAVGAQKGSAKSVQTLCGWARPLEKIEIFEFAANPWQIFRSQPRRIYSFPSGPIALPTLSGASFASRVPSVTLTY